MSKALLYIGVGIAAIFLAGIILDELGGGKWGTLLQFLAKKTTRGYGVAAA